jgi:hypothetical protein
MSRQVSPDRIFFWLFLAGLTFIAFIGGAVSFKYNLQVTQPVQEAIEAAEAYYDRLTNSAYMEVPAANELHINSVDESVKNARVYWDKEKASPGYTLITLRYSTTAYLVDMEGRIVHRWDIPFKKAFPKPTHTNPRAKAIIYLEKAHLFPNGDLLVTYTGWRDTPYGYGMAKVDKDSNILWTYNANVHHGFSIDQENGNIYTLTQQFIRQPIKGLPDLTLPVLADNIVTLSPEGKEIDKIPLLEAFRDSAYVSLLYSKSISGLDWDLFHTNSVEKLEPSVAGAFPMFKPGYLMISSRSMNVVAVIDPVLRKVVWAYNGLWKGQHAVHFLDTGKILLLDNFGYYVAGRPASRVLEFDPRDMQIKWQFAGKPSQPFYTYAYGRAQRLPNGNTLIAETLNSRVFEITREGQIVWDFKLPPLFIKLDPALPPYTNNIPKGMFQDPGFSESYKTMSNLANAVVDAERYQEEEISF